MKFRNSRRLTRRTALTLLGGAPFAALAAAGESPRVSITMDDVAWGMIPAPYRDSANQRILSALQRHKIRAALFVAGRNVDSPRGREILQSWSERGHLIGNHTWSHRNYNSVDPAEFGADMLRCDALVRSFRGFRPFFRFPMLKEGDTRERRDWMRAFLRDHGYRNGAVTIDTSDWYYDQRLRERLSRDPGFDVNRYRAPYLAHMEKTAAYYDGLARRCLGHSVPHTLLVHYNLLNTLFLGDLLDMFVKKGYRLIDAAAAFADRVFERQPGTVPAGESLVWALAKESGRFEGELRYPGEDSAYEKRVLDGLDL